MDGETSQKLFETWYMKLFSFVMTLAKEKTLAEEITQETFYRAMTTDRDYRGEAGEFTWLCSIAKNLFIDEMRRRRRIGELTDSFETEHDDPEELLTREDTALRTHRALHALEEPYKEVFSLRVFGELSFAKIGTVFGKTENWARVTFYRAKLKIQERMDTT